MISTTVKLLILPLVLLTQGQEPPEPISVYCYSDHASDDPAFTFDLTDAFCASLGRFGKEHKSVELVEDKGRASVEVQFLGLEPLPGETAPPVDEKIPPEFRNQMKRVDHAVRAAVRFQDVEKEFERTGTKAERLLAEDIETWIRKNPGKVRAKN